MGSVNGGEKRRHSGITVRWLLTTILVIFIILASVDCAAVFLVRRYYRNTVQEKLDSIGQSAAIAEYFSSCLGATGDVFAARAREYVENLSDTKTAEVWVIDPSGEVVVTSTGFMPDSAPYPDYESALESSSGRAFYTGRFSSGERIMALTVLLPLTDGHSSGGVRYIISLEPTDEQTGRIAVMTSLICVFALVLVIVSGLFFVRSIVVPVNRLNTAARSIAKGNYKQKVEITNRFDEISELCDSINYMTQEIDRTDRMRNDFISTVSHELRTPLTAIRGWSDTLLSLEDKNAETDTINTGLHVINTETDRLYSLVEDLLDFSRMESGRLTLRLSKTDLCAELEDTLLVMLENASRDGKKLTYELTGDPVITYADPDRLKQVFVNILDNAIKYTDAGGEIRVTGDSDGSVFTAVFADNGCGIAPEDLPHVTEKFYKANISVRGSGIGLAVSDEIIKLHGGSLKIESKPGKGTVVTVTLPLSAQKNR